MASTRERGSPYLLYGYSRLTDVIAAIQAMGDVHPATMKVEDWKAKIDSHDSPKEWEKILEEHPEFFRVKIEKDPATGTIYKTAVLRWRHAYKHLDPMNNTEYIYKD